MKKLLTLFCLLLIISCSHKKHYNEKVKSYRVHTFDTNNNDVWLYYYIMTMNNNSCYYYSSSSPTTSFSNVTWNQSTVNPLSQMSTADYEPMQDQQVSVTDLPAEVQSEMEANPENFEGMTEIEMGDYEGTGNDNSGNDNSSTDSDAGSSDSGGGDSDGGSGGGD